MKLRLAILVALPLVAQEPAANPDPAPAGPAAQPEPVFSGSVDIGYRWRSDVGGDVNSYRSVVNLGEGPKLFGVDLSLRSASQRFFDRIDVRGANWGGDPYNTARVDAVRHGGYHLSFDYRNIAYFNFLPSFADPTIDRGVFLNQRSFDTHRRLIDTQLDLMPGKWIVPYLAYTHDSGFGTGITDFVSDANEYPVATRLRDKTDHYRGGLRFELRRFHVTLEQGGSTFKDDQRVFTSGQNPGNRRTPIFGETLFLTNLEQAYGVRGTSIYSKALVTATPASWVDLYGQFLYSRPQTDVSYAQINSGHFVLSPSLLFFDRQLDQLSAEAKLPHSSGSVGAELRPLGRLRVIESWMTDRLHNASFANLAEQILLPSFTGNRNFSLADRLVWNYNQEQVDVLYDATAKLTLRGGYRYVWGDAQTRVALNPTSNFELGELRRHVGLAGANFRPNQKLYVNLDLEAASGDRTYFRTSLQDYQKVRIRGRYQPRSSLAFTAGFSLLNNQNPAPTIHYDFLKRENSLSVLWTPGGGKRVSLLGEYTRATLRSDLSYFVPQILERDRSFYRDNAHIGTGMLDLALPGPRERAPRLSCGGSFFVSSGSRPASHYQPVARLSVPLHKHLEWNSEWRWYGLGEQFYLYEGFRAHLFVTGLRLIR